VAADAITHRAAVDLRDMALVPSVVGRLRPADIVLLWRVGRANTVCWYQRLCGYPELGLRMSHVALYLGQGDLVHSTPSAVRDGVRVDPAADVIARRTVTVVRFPPLAAELRAERSRILQVARAMSGAYDYRAVVELARDSFDLLRRRGAAVPATARLAKAVAGRTVPAGAEAFLCGDFVFDVFDRILRERNPLNLPELMRSPARVPAEFFVNPRLVDVGMRIRPPAARGGPRAG
jgi:hypothetical protein